MSAPTVAWREHWTGPARRLLVVVGSVLLGLLGGVAVAAFGPLVPLVLVVGLVGVALVLVEPRWGLLGVLAVIALLPFGTLPFKVAVTPTFLELALGLTWAVFASRLLLHREERLRVTRLDAPLLLFLVVTLFAFLLGLGQGYTPQTLHDYAKLLLAISLFFLVTNLVRQRADLVGALTGLVAAGAVAAVVGLGLYALGRRAESILARLAAIGYPTGKILRYIEDNPAKALRVTGTAVDPNSFAGFLMVALVLAIAQAAARRPLVPRALAVVAVPPLGLALLLTYSRAAWVGAAVGVLVLALFRYRWLLVPLALAGTLAQALHLGGGFVRRLVVGLQLKDPATKLRLAEYRNALAIIRDHPLFGVGFGAAPSIDLQTGVSSIYLTIAERAGLLGLGLFVVVFVLLGLRLLPVLRRSRVGTLPEEEATLALAGALVAALVAGALDHYFFHIGFAHMVALFWGVVALAVVAGEASRQAGAEG